MVHEYKGKKVKRSWAKKGVEKKKKGMWFDAKKWLIERICTFCSQLYVLLILLFIYIILI